MRKRRIVHARWHQGMSTTLCGLPYGFDHTRWAVNVEQGGITCKRCLQRMRSEEKKALKMSGGTTAPAEREPPESVVDSPAGVSGGTPSEPRFDSVYDEAMALEGEKDNGLGDGGGPAVVAEVGEPSGDSEAHRAFKAFCAKANYATDDPGAPHEEAFYAGFRASRCTLGYCDSDWARTVVVVSRDSTGKPLDTIACFGDRDAVRGVQAALAAEPAGGTPTGSARLPEVALEAAYEIPDALYAAMAHVGRIEEALRDIDAACLAAMRIAPVTLTRIRDLARAALAGGTREPSEKAEAEAGDGASAVVAEPGQPSGGSA